MNRVGTQAIVSSRQRPRAKAQNEKHSSFRGWLVLERPLRKAKRAVELVVYEQNQPLAPKGGAEEAEANDGDDSLQQIDGAADTIPPPLGDPPA